MRRTSLLSTLLLIATTPAVALAQSLAVVSTTPADGSDSISLESTIAFEFSAAIDTSYRYPGGMPVELFTVSPPDSIVIDRVHYSADLTTVLFDVRHAPDTDFLWILTGARTKTDTLLCSPGVINYSTSASRGSYTVSGTAYGVALVKRFGCGQFGTLTALIYDKLRTNGGIPLGAAIVDPNDDYRFSISGVRNGVYWPAVITDINENGVIEPEFPRLPELDYYRNLDNSVQNVVVADQDVEGVEIMILVGLSSDQPSPSRKPGIAANYPNPFTADTNIEIEVAQPGPAEVRIFDLTGRLQYHVRTNVLPIGRQTIRLDLSRLAAGAYVARVELVGSTYDLLLAKPG